MLYQLIALNKTNNWQAVLGKLADPAFAGLTNKPPFRDQFQAAKLAQMNAITHHE